jgi:hypothetical protein
VRPRKPRPGGFGHHVRRYYGRCAGCFRWTGTGARRVTPPRAASQETWPEVEKPRPRNFGQSRGGAPRGERARSGRSVQTDGPWRAPRPKRERVATAVGVARSIFSLRLPALRLPSFYLEAKHQWLSFLPQSSGAVASRERGRLHPPPPRQRGRGTTGARGASEPWWRGRLRCRFVAVEGE